jgi:hypothetical protein
MASPILLEKGDRQLADSRQRQVSAAGQEASPLLQDVSIHKGLFILLEEEGGFEQADKLENIVRLYADTIEKNLQSQGRYQLKSKL